MNKKTQKDRILQHLQNLKSITPWEAIKEYGCLRLAAVIHRLKEDYNITTDMVETTNRFGDKVSYAKYVYVGKKVLN